MLPAPMIAGPTIREPADRRALLDHDPADDLAVVVDGAVEPRLEALEDQAVHLEHVGDVAGVLPVPGDRRRVDRAAVVEQPLDRLGDLKLAPPGRLEAGDRLVDGRGEQVDADQGEVALGLPAASPPGS